MRRFKVVVVVLAAAGLMSTASVAVSQASEFKTAQGNYPIDVAGSQAGFDFRFTFETGPNMTVTEARCPVTDFSGWTSGPTSGLYLQPEYQGLGGTPCKAFGLNATITTTGCEYLILTGSELSPGEFAAALNIGCGAGDVIKVVASTCEIQIGSQAGIGPTWVENIGKGLVEWEIAAPGVKYTITKDGIGCPLRSTGGTGAVPLTLSDGALGGVAQLGATYTGTPQTFTVN